jgi:hypothetical protein|tara:strand:+ start:676 stop:1014 length:339 start_codon:yes stop_codon:yes gene_type:complete
MKKCLKLLLALFFCTVYTECCFSQITAIYFNATWNSANEVKWFDKLNDVEHEVMDIGKGDCQKKYKIAVVPTILLIKDGEEVKRFQADLSFKLMATKKEIQNIIDELLMEDF